MKFFSSKLFESIKCVFIDEARRFNIIMHYVSSGATYFAQPLDVCLFIQLKNLVRKEVKDLMFACPDEKKIEYKWDVWDVHKS